MNCDCCNRDCVFGDDYFMVTDETWYDEAGLAHDDFLCRGCLTAVLGRALVREDYTTAIINWGILEREFDYKPWEDPGFVLNSYTHRSVP